jgi:tetratricopeptide (TPR) repeat protein
LESKLDPSVAVIEEYKRAKEYKLEKKYVLSNEYFKKVLQILSNSGMQLSPDYAYVMKQMALNYNLLRKYDEANKCFEEVVEIVDQLPGNEYIRHVE